jgi:hypothetical protein
MIISERVKVKSSLYYKEKGYDISDKYIIVDIKDIPVGSRTLVIAICDFCNLKKEITYRDYNNNIKRGNKYACSIKCGTLKAKEGNLIKIGVESHFQLDEFKEKSKKSLIKNWGVEHISKSKVISELKSNKMKEKSEEVSNRMLDYYKNLSSLDIKKINQKREKTNLEKWGYEYVSQVKSIKEKIRNTNLEKWGGYTYQSDVLMRKVISTNLEKWGLTHSSSSDIIKNKIKNSNLEKWGYEYPSKSPIIKEKIKNSNLEKWGVENIMFLPDVVKDLKDRFYNKYGTDSFFKTDFFKKSDLYNPMSDDFLRKNLIINKNKYYIRYLNDKISEFNCDFDKEHTFLINSINFHNRIRTNSKLCTVCNPIGDSKSIKEEELFEFIKSIYFGEIIQSYRDGLEIDIYLPHLKLGFEFNGLYWHSEEWKDKLYHLDKTNYFSEKGIRIIHIWEDDWDFKKGIVKSQLRNWLGLTSSKIFARKCYVKEIDKFKYINFLENNHIQGYTKATLKLGLFYENELVSLMSFDKMEGRRKMEKGGWNLTRFCSKLNTNVIGGSSKILKHFIKEYKPNRIISYADRDWSEGSLYTKLGFKLTKILKPDYKYIYGNKRVNKQRFTKKRLKNIGLDINKTESDLTKEIGIYKIYNVGKLKFELFQ